MKTGKKIKKLSLQYQYLLVDFEEVKEELTSYQQQFTNYLISLEKTYSLQIFDINTKKVEKVEKSCENDVKLDKKRDSKQNQLFRDLYNQIAVQTHPDKTGDNQDRSGLFRKATRAKNDNDLMTIIDMCGSLDIEVPDLSEDHIDIIEKNIKQLQSKINSHKNMDAYIWGVADEKKRDVIERAIVNRYKTQST